MPTIVGILTLINEKKALLAHLILNNAEFLDMFILMSILLFIIAKFSINLFITSGLDIIYV